MLKGRNWGKKGRAWKKNNIDVNVKERSSQ